MARLIVVGDLIGAGASQEQVTMIAAERMSQKRPSSRFNAKIAFNGRYVFRTAT